MLLQRVLYSTLLLCFAFTLSACLNYGVYNCLLVLKVRSNMPEKDVAAAIIKKFQEVNVSVSFAELARAAKACGRHKLAAEVCASTCIHVC